MPIGNTAALNILAACRQERSWGAFFLNVRGGRAPMQRMSDFRLHVTGSLSWRGPCDVLHGALNRAPGVVHHSDPSAARASGILLASLEESIARRIVAH